MSVLWEVTAIATRSSGIIISYAFIQSEKKRKYKQADSPKPCKTLIMLGFTLKPLLREALILQKLCRPYLLCGEWRSSLTQGLSEVIILVVPGCAPHAEHADCAYRTRGSRPGSQPGWCRYRRRPPKRSDQTTARSVLIRSHQADSTFR